MHFDLILRDGEILSEMTRLPPTARLAESEHSPGRL